mmetsp:Transcript_6384/g.5693  ORF Transcript_6384/g.5693 Transcript_6384/m.5693 type:complete len:384 (-) Transcript_6384:67-1218(-)
MKTYEAYDLKSRLEARWSLASDLHRVKVEDVPSPGVHPLVPDHHLIFIHMNVVPSQMSILSPEEVASSGIFLAELVSRGAAVGRGDLMEVLALDEFLISDFFPSEEGLSHVLASRVVVGFFPSVLSGVRIHIIRLNRIGLEVLVAVEEEVEVVVHEEGHVVLKEVGLVIVVPPKDHVVLDGSLPDDVLVLVPLCKDVLDPFVLLVAELDIFIGAAVGGGLGVGVLGVAVGGAFHEAGVRIQHPKLLPIPNRVLLLEIKVRHLPMLPLFGELELPLSVELAVVVASDHEEVQVPQVFCLEQPQQGLELLVCRVLRQHWVDIIPSQDHEVDQIFWVGLIGGCTQLVIHGLEGPLGLEEEVVHDPVVPSQVEVDPLLCLPGVVSCQ